MWGNSRSSTPWPAGDLAVGAQLGLSDCVGDGGVADVAARLWPWGGEGVPPNGVHKKLNASMLSIGSRARAVVLEYYGSSDIEYVLDLYLPRLRDLLLKLS